MLQLLWHQPTMSVTAPLNSPDKALYPFILEHFVGFFLHLVHIYVPCSRDSGVKKRQNVCGDQDSSRLTSNLLIESVHSNTRITVSKLAWGVPNVYLINRKCATAYITGSNDTRNYTFFRRKANLKLLSNHRHWYTSKQCSAILVKCGGTHKLHCEQ